MRFTKPMKPIGDGTGRVSDNLRNLQKAVKRLTPTGGGISHGPLGTAYIPRRSGRGSAANSAPAWL